MTALKRLARLVSRKDAILHRQYCGISSAMQEPIRLAGDQKAVCFAGYGMARMDQLRVIAVADNG